MWKLSDLSSQEIARQAFQEHWKTPAGYVVALPSCLIRRWAVLQLLASLNAVPPQSGEVDRSNVDLSSHGYVVALLNQPSCLIRRWAVPPQSGEVDRSNVNLSSHGYVVALLNQPSCLIRRWAVPPQSGEVDRSNVALSLGHPQKLMQMGVSQDFTLCKATTMRRSVLTLPINRTGVWRITR